MDEGRHAGKGSERGSLSSRQTGRGRTLPEVLRDLLDGIGASPPSGSGQRSAVRMAANIVSVGAARPSQISNASAP